MAHVETTPEGPKETDVKRGIFRWNTFSALQHTNYRYLWFGDSFSSVAGWIQQITLALLVADITDSPFWVTTVLGIRALPILLIGPLAGVAVDRMDRKKLFMATQLFLFAIAFLFAFGVWKGQVNEYHALLFSFLLGVDMSINRPVRLSMIANVVPKEDLTNALALENSAGNIIRVVAPAIGVALISPFGLSGNFFIQAAAYLAVCLIILPMRTPYREEVARGDSVVGTFMEGLRHLRTDSVLLLLIVLIIVPSVVVHSTQYMLVIFAKDILGGEEKVGLAILLTAMGIGALVGTFGVASLGNFQKKGLVNMATIMLVTVLLVFFGLSSHLILSAVLIGLLGLVNMVSRITNNALVQSRTPDVLRGRITSIYVIDHGVQPLAIPLLGFLAEPGILGPGKAVMAAGLVALSVTAFIGLRWRELWRLH